MSSSYKKNHEIHKKKNNNLKKHQIKKKEDNYVRKPNHKELKLPSYKISDVRKQQSYKLNDLIKNRLLHQAEVRKKEEKTRHWYVFFLYIVFSIVILIIIFLLISFIFSEKTSYPSINIIGNPTITDEANLYYYLKNNIKLITSNDSFNLTAYNKLKKMSPEEIKLSAGLTHNFCIVLTYSNGSIVKSPSGHNILICSK